MEVKNELHVFELTVQIFAEGWFLELRLKALLANIQKRTEKETNAESLKLTLIE
jgi:hypothetical protein